SSASSSSESRCAKSSPSLPTLVLRAFQIGAQPRARAHPSSLYRAQRGAQRLRRLLLAEPAEVAALEDARQALVALAESVERAVEVDQLLGVGLVPQAGLVQL